MDNSAHFWTFSAHFCTFLAKFAVPIVLGHARRVYDLLSDIVQFLVKNGQKLPKMAVFGYFGYFGPFLTVLSYNK